jgi:predicted HNH restriction endonuclease
MKTYKILRGAWIMETENYVYKKEIDWSVLMEGFTLPMDNQVIFMQNMGRFLKRGESKLIHFYMNGITYNAKIVNMNNPQDKRTKDAYQIRYTRNGELSRALQMYFSKSFSYISQLREMREVGDRRMIKVPEDRKEYLAIYTTEYDDTFLLEPIVSSEIMALRQIVAGKTERNFEATFDYEITDEKASLSTQLQIVRIRKLNRKIGENLKLLYGYRCQICGRLIGEEYGSHIAEAHHIDYFVNSLNNDANNQMILCPNHHSIIHDVNPVFDRKRLIYIYKNGLEEKLMLNQHL